MENFTHVYPVSVSWSFEKKGILRSPGLPELPTATPPEFPGGQCGYMVTGTFVYRSSCKLSHDHISGYCREL